MSYKGSCLCGQVCFEIDEFPMDMWKCHCTRCRKRFGGASGAATFVPKNSFRWISGADSQQSFEFEGQVQRRCDKCGSLVPGLYEKLDMMWIPMGLVEGDPPIKLVRHAYVDYKANWEILDDEVERFGKSSF